MRCTAFLLSCHLGINFYRFLFFVLETVGSLVIANVTFKGNIFYPPVVGELEIILIPL